MAVGPARAIKSPSISAITTTTNAIMGASRMRPATTAADAQFRTLFIAPSRTQTFSRCRRKCERLVDLSNSEHKSIRLGSELGWCDPWQIQDEGIFEAAG
jgi:hypothetical protein